MVEYKCVVCVCRFFFIYLCVLDRERPAKLGYKHLVYLSTPLLSPRDGDEWLGETQLVDGNVYHGPAEGDGHAIGYPFLFGATHCALSRSPRPPATYFGVKSSAKSEDFQQKNGPVRFVERRGDAREY